MRLNKPRCFRLFTQLLFACAAVGVTSTPSQAADPNESWSRFRGENGVGVAETCSVPIPWASSDVAWSIDLPGAGNGSPVVRGNQVFVQSADPKTAARSLMCLDLASGGVLWKRDSQGQPHRVHRRSSFASPTPCVADNAVYVVWGQPDKITIASYSLDGKTENWTRDLGRFQSQHGYGASPALFGDTLVLFNSQQGEQLRGGQRPGKSSVIALNAMTGKTIWQTDLTTRRVCYGVPTLYETAAGKPALLFANTGDGLFALDLASGDSLWNKQVFEKRCVSSPQVVAGLAIGTEGSGGGGNRLFAVDLEGDHEVKFRITRNAPYVPTPVVKGNLLFLWDDNGVASCVEVPSGKVLWSERASDGPVSSSPVIAGDKLIGISESGSLVVLAAKGEYEKLGSVDLQDLTRATPVVGKSYLLVRTNSRLMCIGKP